MEVKYYLFDPTGNITLLVETPVEEKYQPEIAQKLMEIETTAEQVGFVNGDSLRMAGGEFCGNASMSAAALYCMKNGISAGETRTLSLNVSGADEKVNVEITADSDGFTGTVEMPKCEAIESKAFEFDGKIYTLPVVKFKGISHIISENVLDRITAENAVKKWCAELGESCLGIMLCDVAKQNLEPLVYVSTAGTLFWEHSCASGTSAVGAYLLAKGGKAVDFNISEPGGVLSVYADENSIKLSGRVKLLKENTTEI